MDTAVVKTVKGDKGSKGDHGEKGNVGNLGPGGNPVSINYYSFLPLKYTRYNSKNHISFVLLIKSSQKWKHFYVKHELTGGEL